MPSFLLRKKSYLFHFLDAPCPLWLFHKLTPQSFQYFLFPPFTPIEIQRFDSHASFFRKLPDCSLSRNYCTTVRGHRKGKVDFMIKKYTVSHKKVVDRTFKDVLGGKIVWLISTTLGSFCCFCPFGLFWPFWPFWVFWPFDLFGSFGLLILLAFLAFLFCFVCFFACLVFLVLLIFSFIVGCFVFCFSSLWPPCNLLAFQ